MSTPNIFKSLCPNFLTTFAVSALLSPSPITAPAWAAELTANQLLEKVDDVRNPSASFFLKVEVKSDDDVEGPWKGDVLIKGPTKSLVKTQAPARVKGQNYLMIDQDMWAYVPNMKKAVRVALSERLTGAAANGDIARTRWSGDYDATYGEKKGDIVRLDLKATRKGLTYERIRVWVNKGNFRPDRAEYLSLKGKLLKKAKFGGYKSLAGKIRPSQLEIEHLGDSGKKSVIEIQEMRVEEFPDALFTKQSLQ